MEDLYSTLGVPRTATAAEISKAYRRLARKHHPDLNPGKPEAEKKFKQASAAYEILSDLGKRKAYDEFGEDSLKSGFDPAQARTYHQWKGRPSASGGPFSSQRVDFDLDGLFSEVFGRSSAHGFSAHGSPTRHGVRGADVRAVVELDLAQALEGAEVSLQVPSSEPCATCSGTGHEPHTSAQTCLECGGSGEREVVEGPMRVVRACPACHGRGRTGQRCSACAGEGTRETLRHVTVRIPPGADNGSILRIPSNDVFGSTAGSAGNLVIETKVRPHPWVRRDGLDLHLKLPISLDEAYNGAQIEVPTFRGPVKLRVPSGSQSGAQLRLRGKGVRRGAQHGDLYVELDVMLPPGRDEKLAKVIRATGSHYAQSRRSEVTL